MADDARWLSSGSGPCCLASLNERRAAREAPQRGHCERNQRIRHHAAQAYTPYALGSTSPRSCHRGAHRTLSNARGSCVITALATHRAALQPVVWLSTRRERRARARSTRERPPSSRTRPLAPPKAALMAPEHQPARSDEQTFAAHTVDANELPPLHQASFTGAWGARSRAPEPLARFFAAEARKKQTHRGTPPKRNRRKKEQRAFRRSGRAGAATHPPLTRQHNAQATWRSCWARWAFTAPATSAGRSGALM